MSERADTIFECIQASLRQGQAVALATVVKAQGSVPRHVGAKMLIYPDGSTVGTIGGAEMERRAIEEAQEALAEGKPRLTNYVFGGKEPESVGLCGGQVEVFIDVIQPDPRLLIIGSGHIAQPLAVLGRMMGLQVIVVDDRPDYATPERFPDADQIVVDEVEEAVAKVGVTPSTYVVIATYGYDDRALKAVVNSPAAYIGLVASWRKFSVIAHDLQQEGVSQEALARVHSPTGLDLKGETPAEIALSIMAEITMLRHGGTGGSLWAKYGPQGRVMAQE
ncbi:MAG: XdhC family protein [Anaerolineae bacterium]